MECMLLIGSDTLSYDVGTINGSDMKTLKTKITMTPRGSKIVNQAIGTISGEGGQLQEMQSITNHSQHHLYCWAKREQQQWML
jgi:hypothetical protein